MLGDQIFWQSVKVTGIFAIVATAVETVLGVGLALLLNRSSIIGKIFEKVLILPLMIAPVIAGVIWKLMFNPQFGMLNHVLGLGNTFDWLSGDHGTVVGDPGRRLDLHAVRGDPGARRHPVAARENRSRRPKWTARTGSTCSAS